MPDSDNITELLSKLHRGDLGVVSELLPQIRVELRRIARLYFNKEGAAHSIDPSDLVQDTTFRLLQPGIGPWNSREHFFSVAAINIRRRLVEHARARLAKKRGGGLWKRVLLEDDVSIRDEDVTELLDVDRALRELEALNPRQGRVVVLRIFAGMTVEETAKELGISRTTVNQDWAVATAFLRRELNSYRDASPMGTN
jgi:RNA polymerase sigma-70 factor (ECF subfamily)